MKSGMRRDESKKELSKMLYFWLNNKTVKRDTE